MAFYPNDKQSFESIWEVAPLCWMCSLRAGKASVCRFDFNEGGWVFDPVQIGQNKSECE